MTKPVDCYAKAEIAKALGIGYARFYQVWELKSPKPDGWYVGGFPAKKKFPYWHINTLNKWLKSFGKVSLKKPNKPIKIINENLWAVPAKDERESLVSLQTRNFINLMNVGLR